MGQCCCHNQVVNDDWDTVERVPTSQTYELEDTRSATRSVAESEMSVNSIFSTKENHEPSEHHKKVPMLRHITELHNSVSIEHSSGSSIIRGISIEGGGEM